MNIKIEKKTLVMIFIFILCALIFGWALDNIEAVQEGFKNAMGILTPLVLGFCIAFILNVPMRFFERILFPNAKNKAWRILRRPVCLIISMVIIITILTIVVALVIPEFINALFLLAESISVGLPSLIEWAEKNIVLNEQLEGIVGSFNIDWAETGREILSYATNGATSILTGAVGILSAIAGGVTNAFLAIVFALYIIFGKETLKHQFASLLKAVLSSKVHKGVLFVAKMTTSAFEKFIVGQCTEAVIIGGLSFIGMTIFGFPYAPMVSALVGVLALVPIVGAVAGSIIGAFMILLVNPVQAIWFLVFSIVLQQLEGNLIYPKVVGGSIGLPGIWVLTSVTVGAGLGGILGMLLAVPICSVIYTLVKLFTQKRLADKKEALENSDGTSDAPHLITSFVSVVTEDEGASTDAKSAKSKKSEKAENLTDV